MSGYVGLPPKHRRVYLPPLNERLKNVKCASCYPRITYYPFGCIGPQCKTCNKSITDGFIHAEIVNTPLGNTGLSWMDVDYYHQKCFHSSSSVIQSNP